MFRRPGAQASRGTIDNDGFIPALQAGKPRAFEKSRLRRRFAAVRRPRYGVAM